MIVAIIIALAIILIDQLSKWIVVENLTSQVCVIKDFFYLTYAGNKGIAWGMSVSKWILIIITIVALALFIYMLIKHKDFKKNKWICITIGFLIGGTIGNFIDRLFRADGVVDFLDFIIYYPDITNSFKWTAYDFPIFNVADSFLVVGAIMVIIYVLFLDSKKDKIKKDEDNVQ